MARVTKKTASRLMVPGASLFVGAGPTKIRYLISIWQNFKRTNFT